MVNVKPGDHVIPLYTAECSELLQAACDATGHPLTMRMQRGYDHSNYFIATFLGDHFDLHAHYVYSSVNSIW